MAFDNLANPFRQPEPGPRRPPTSNPNELRRLYIMGIVFLMVVGLMIYVKKTGLTDKTTKKESPAPGQVDYSIKGDPKKDPGQAQTDPATPEDKPKRDIPIPPLPKDGVINFKELAAPFRDGQEKPVKETPEFIGL